MNLFQRSFAESSPNPVLQKTAIDGTFDALNGIVTAIYGIFVAHILHSMSAKLLPNHTRRVRRLPTQSSFERPCCSYISIHCSVC